MIRLTKLPVSKMFSTRNTLLILVGWPLFFFQVFIGDFVVGRVPAFFIILPLLSAYIWLFEFRLSVSEFAAMMVCSLLMLLLMLIHSEDVGFYYYSFLFSVFFIPVLRLVPVLIKNPLTPYLMAFMLILLGGVALAQFSSGVLRASIIWGPNIYYRIIGVLTVVLILSSMRGNVLNRSMPILLVVSVGIMLSTGSRGSIVVMVFILALFVFDYFRLRYRRYRYYKIAIFFFLMLAFVVFFSDFFIEVMQRVFWRIFYFSEDNNSIQTRGGFLVDGLEYTKNITVVGFVFGNGYSNDVFNYYPHNAVLEFFVYHGIVLTSLLFFYFFLLVRSVIKYSELRQSDDYLVLFFAPIFIGSMLSGSMLESFVIVSVSLYILVKNLIINY